MTPRPPILAALARAVDSAPVPIDTRAAWSRARMVLSTLGIYDVEFAPDDAEDALHGLRAAGRITAVKWDKWEGPGPLADMYEITDRLEEVWAEARAERVRTGWRRL